MFSLKKFFKNYRNIKAYSNFGRYQQVNIGFGLPTPKSKINTQEKFKTLRQYKKHKLKLISNPKGEGNIIVLDDIRIGNLRTDLKSFLFGPVKPQFIENNYGGDKLRLIFNLVLKENNTNVGDEERFYEQQQIFGELVKVNGIQLNSIAEGEWAYNINCMKGQWIGDKDLNKLLENNANNIHNVNNVHNANNVHNNLNNDINNDMNNDMNNDIKKLKLNKVHDLIGYYIFSF